MAFVQFYHELATQLSYQFSNSPVVISKGFASFSTTVIVGFRAPRSISLT
jgi:hypothetical protein